jgi:pimeloyl-ACP methyl ester carboxylesterase
LNWYRALGTDPPRSNLISAPVLHIWGDRDPVFTREATELTAAHCTGDYHLLELEGGSHWIPDEHWADISDLVVEHLAAHPLG